VFLSHQIRALSELYDVTIIANLNGDQSMLDSVSGVARIINLPIERNISLLADLKALFLLVIVFYKNKFSLVHSVSPKAGILNAIAARVTRIPVRLHTFTGQVWVTKKGLTRRLFKLIDRVIVLLNTNILVDSASQQKFLIQEGILPKSSSCVIGQGSISGVDTHRFAPSRLHKDVIRKRLDINNDCLVFLFVGRLKKEKGVFELIEAFKNICSSRDNVALLIVGPDEDGLRQVLVDNLVLCNRLVRFINFTRQPEQYMAASDIFVLPSYREGFGNVVIEAASCGLPSIGSNIYGLSDAIKDKKTGLLVPVKSKELLREAMLKLADNDKMREKMGRNARIRASRYFSQEGVTLGILQTYQTLIDV